jgi:cytochrome c-type biogenesis protein CcmF
MIVELGHFALILALMVALVQSTLPLWGAQVNDARLMALGGPAALVQLALVAASFGVLTWAFVASDFSLAVVVSNSHTEKPLIYKISGVWGNHEGSLLLWVLILALYGAAVAVWGGNLPVRLRARVLSVQGMIGVAFMLFMLLTSNPFWRLAAPPGRAGPEPLAAGPRLGLPSAVPVPRLCRLSMAYSFAVAALIEGKVDAAWGRWVRPWTLAAWIFLTIGIGLGSWWAYYELGWGGFWFWDPVENASFMPWLLAIALLHSAIVVEKRESLKAWTILLAIMAFGFSLIGTFIVRSGVITSVHAFANDPDRGVFILLILGVFTGGALILYALRAGAMEAKGVFSLVSRESALVANNIILAVSAFVVFIGTIWPLIAELLLGRTLSVGEPFFNAAFTPFVVALALILPPGAMLAWKRGSLERSLRALVPALILALALGALAFAMQTNRTALGPIGLALGAWVLFGALADLWARTGREGVASRFARLGRLPRSDWGKAVAHGGLGVTIFAVSAMLAWKIEDIRVVQIGETFPLGAYEVRLDDVREVEGPNYLSTMGFMTVMRDGEVVTEVNPREAHLSGRGDADDRGGD